MFIGVARVGTTSEMERLWVSVQLDPDPAAGTTTILSNSLTDSSRLFQDDYFPVIDTIF